MVGSITYILIAVGLFALAYFSKRRFGLIGLSLAAGSVLASIWGYEAGLTAGVLGIQTNQTTSTIASCALILLPPIILMFHGKSYKTHIGKIIGSVCFAILALAFLITPLSGTVSVQGNGSNVYEWFTANSRMIIGIGLSLAVLDLFLTKPAHDKHDKHHKH